MVNRLGFPSAGMEAAARPAFAGRTGEDRKKFGWGSTWDPTRTRRRSAWRGCATLVARLGPMADFIVINVSSPNTPGLRDWQSAARLAPLMRPIMAEAIKLDPRRPILVKLAPDLNAPVLASVCEAVAAAGVDGLVACNTTTAREMVGVRTEHEGGLSGEPLRKRAAAMVAEIRRRIGSRMPIIGVGGVSSAEDAYRLICAGAEPGRVIYGTGLRGAGPGGANEQGLLELMERDGLSSIAEAVGSAAPSKESELW